MQTIPSGTPATKVRARRVEAGLSQQQLATDAGIGLKTLSRIEAGEDVRLGTLTAIADALGCSVSELLADPADVAS